MNIQKFTERAQEAVISAQNLATELNHSEITPEHLLVTLVEQEGGIVPSVLRRMEMDPAQVARDARGLFHALPTAYGADIRFSPRVKLVTDGVLQALTAIRGNQRVTSQNPETTYESLTKYGRDLTDLARRGKLDPVIGR